MLSGLRYRKAVFISTIIIILILISNEGQTKTKVSTYEFRWALAHPFIAAKAKDISDRALLLTDSIEKTGLLKGGSGGQLDAFKHAVWMALLGQQFKANKIYKLGLAHEKSNYRQAKKGRGGGDQTASEMDLWNNEVGAKIGVRYPSIAEKDLIELIIKAIKSGEMRIVKVDRAGESLDCEGILIDKSTLKTWENKGCLVASDYQYN